MTLIEIIKRHLIEGGFDGLVNTDYQCGCLRDDLIPCDGAQPDCTTGYKHISPKTGNWSIWAQKEQPTAEQWALLDED